MEDFPIIFIHKSGIKDNISKQSFLKTTLKCASLFNPQKNIIFLGDNGNKHFSNNIGANVKFNNIDDYGGELKEMKTFKQVFRVIKGPLHGSEEWIKFVFQRFFHLYDFLDKNNITSFWMFDSDTLIIDNLKNHEHKYIKFDCTEQCNGSCINGFISNKEIIKKYINSINNLFMNTEYINKQIEEFNTINLNYALTEMRAYREFKKNNIFKSIDLSTPIDKTTFDNCICQTFGPNNDKINKWEMDTKTNLKKIYVMDNGIFFRWLPTNELIKVNTLNLSWVPNNLFDVLFSIAKRYL